MDPASALAVRSGRNGEQSCAVASPRLIVSCSEFQNPGGSVKDRAAAWIIKDAEKRGVLVPGQPGIIVEGNRLVILLALRQVASVNPSFS